MIVDIANAKRVFANAVASWATNNKDLIAEIDKAILHAAEKGEIEAIVDINFINKHIVAHLYRTKGFNVWVPDSLSRTTRIVISGWAK